ncbi:hypothetical protein RHSIM_Rhsim13G0142800 [Rhododendron simsii]|uniref:Uncharacterized protein n=1 Tax=Rhododendron simsii TaxID=118357 RepID=A0A834G2H3_RHOSS|nr:hypothetical protein RHSIM_Rhsim13G0142800 [Rhododendron simsii]
MIYQDNIKKLVDTLEVYNTYRISNTNIKFAPVKYRTVDFEWQWMIDASTLIQTFDKSASHEKLLNIDFIPFEQFGQYAYRQATIDILWLLHKSSLLRLQVLTPQVLNKPRNPKAQEIIIINQESFTVKSSDTVAAHMLKTCKMVKYHKLEVYEVHTFGAGSLTSKLPPVDGKTLMKYAAEVLAYNINIKRALSEDNSKAETKAKKKLFQANDNPTTASEETLGLKALEGQARARMVEEDSEDAEDSSVPIFRIEEDMFILLDDVLLLLERAALEPLPPKDVKGPQNPMKVEHGGGQGGGQGLEGMVVVARWMAGSCRFDKIGKAKDSHVSCTVGCRSPIKLFTIIAIIYVEESINYVEHGGGQGGGQGLDGMVVVARWMVGSCRFDKIGFRPIPIVRIEEDMFILVNDVLLLLEGAILEPSHPKDDKGLHSSEPNEAWWSANGRLRAGGDGVCCRGWQSFLWRYSQLINLGDEFEWHSRAAMDVWHLLFIVDCCRLRMTDIWHLLLGQNAEAFGCEVSVKELDSLLSVLIEKKRKMEQEDAETNMQILHDFLHCLRKQKLEELSQFNDLQECYLQKRHGARQSYTQEAREMIHVNAMNTEGNHAGLEDFQSALSTFTRYSIEFDRDDELFATAGVSRRIKVFEFASEASVLNIDMKANICSVKYNPGSSIHVAVGSADHDIHYYDLRNVSQALHVFNGHRKAVSYVKFMSNNELASMSFR